MPYKNKDKRRAYAQSYERKHPRNREEIAMKNKRRQRHGRGPAQLSQAQYEQLLVQQKGLCAICSLPERRKAHGRESSLAVDHNHETQIVRGLLCYACNVGIGFFRENPHALEAAANYIRQRG